MQILLLFVIVFKLDGHWLPNLASQWGMQAFKTAKDFDVSKVSKEFLRGFLTRGRLPRQLPRGQFSLRRVLNQPVLRLAQELLQSIIVAVFLAIYVVSDLLPS